MSHARHVLITGAGMVGAHTARRLLDLGWRVTLLDREVPGEYLRSVLGPAAEYDTLEVDLTDSVAMAAALADLRPTDVVHTAALIAARAQRDVVETIEVNVSAPLRLAAWASSAGVSRFVAVSSWSVYDERQPAPITEDSPVCTRFDSYYVASKLAMEHLLSAFASRSGLATVALRPAVVYGHGPNLGGAVGSAVLEAQMLRAVRGLPVELPATVLSCTELVFVEDVAAAAVAALQADLDEVFSTCTVGSGELTTVEDLADTFRQLFPGVPVTIGPGAASSVVPPVPTMPTAGAQLRAHLGIGEPLRRNDGFARFADDLRAAASARTAM
ncbi:NAD-dependent epimerase/dehydratase family protein [Nakamurella leprariae]|uniref:NAD(P)-dependent oxidoreductase n=1 Tax=Nakamurella leprariae TaxID=2803911 RepID=A0A939C249_9ACTN|nr:NAD(P)-dependent oxidoreductase [Nakamurella leprariae]MBM9467772.1 NAD(P)-dependent oxidoreductase [Nakamurella leprariae]